MEYRIGTQVFGDWHIVKELGKGISGTVYELRKNSAGGSSGSELKSALRVVWIPRSDEELKYIQLSGMDPLSVKAYYRGYVENVIKAVRLICGLKGHPGIVSFEDYSVIERHDGFGGDILIRMELLEGLDSYLSHTSIGEEDALRLGRGLCEALSECHKNGIIHGDIKPSNIFVNEFGDFKLDAFHMAHSSDETVGTRIGFDRYAAPEQYNKNQCDARTDLYSLGIVMYLIMNRGRMPFMAAESMSFSDLQDTFARRMRGESLPKPADASEAFADVILKACAFDAADRYQTAGEMLAALDRVTGDKPIPPTPPKHRFPLWITIAAVCIIASGAFGGYALHTFMADREEGGAESSVDTVELAAYLQKPISEMGTYFAGLSEPTPSMGLMRFGNDQVSFRSYDAEHVTGISVENAENAYAINGVSNGMTLEQAGEVLEQHGFAFLQQAVASKGYVYYDGDRTFEEIIQNEDGSIKVHLDRTGWGLHTDKQEVAFYMGKTLKQVKEEIPGLTERMEAGKVSLSKEGITFSGKSESSKVRSIELTGPDCGYSLYGVSPGDSIEDILDSLGFEEGGSGELIDPMGHTLFYPGSETSISLYDPYG